VSNRRDRQRYAMPASQNADVATNGEPTFRRSSVCAESNCVEVMHNDRLGAVSIRHAAESDLVLVFSPAGWTEFLCGVKAGDFDGLSGR